ncbi:heme exporter protein B [Natronocella acetinitrilica]|uniref:Heme exporter protein B n=1 Tax=Natronocella acetinitrilica TaxID=414046 RepID=A0AAE3KCJ6_9GAMM|nr:heme exporter protein B [Natronocella acetinitrilica]
MTEPVPDRGNLGGAFLALLLRDIRLVYRRSGEWVNPLLFFLIVTTLFPLGVGPGTETLAAIGPGVIWVAALLAAMLSLDNLFRSDFQDGSLEQLVMTHHPLPVLVMAKVLAHWLTTGVPIILLAPLLAMMLQMPGSSVPVLMASLLLGTPILSLLGAIGVALTVGLPRGGVLLALLVLPLYIPTLIFAARATELAAVGLPAGPSLSLLGAMLTLALVLVPFGIATALRISLN